MHSRQQTGPDLRRNNARNDTTASKDWIV